MSLFGVGSPSYLGPPAPLFIAALRCSTYGIDLLATSLHESAFVVLLGLDNFSVTNSLDEVPLNKY